MPIFLVSIVAICFVKRHIPDLRKIPYGNMGDEWFIFIIISCMLISISEGILALFSLYKMIIVYCSVPDDKKDVMHSYMRKIVTESNIFRILSDMISESTGTMGYGYYLNKEYIESLFGEKNIIEDILRKVIPSSETEKFILSMWERMETGATNSLGEKDFYSPVPINLIP